MNLDRFSQGSKDSQEVRPVAECAGCGGEIYPYDMVWVLADGSVTHTRLECLKDRFVESEQVAIKAVQ